PGRSKFYLSLQDDLMRIFAQQPGEHELGDEGECGAEDTDRKGRQRHALGGRTLRLLAAVLARLMGEYEYVIFVFVW
ncbi:hypothetical protein ACCT11_36785, partial [Rhizobium johnstonii]|uniref:hypothetical protein n=1 Tax=Rhizobium johnstonii TaxID=3019933 RepID=UPI003F98DA41